MDLLVRFSHHLLAASSPLIACRFGNGSSLLPFPSCVWHSVRVRKFRDSIVHREWTMAAFWFPSAQWTIVFGVVWCLDLWLALPQCIIADASRMTSHVHGAWQGFKLEEFSWNSLPLLRRPHRMAPVFTFIGSSPPKLWLTGLFELSTITSTSFTAPILTSLCWEPQAMFTSCLYPPPPRVLVPIVLPHANTYYLSIFELWACRLTTYVFGGERFDLASWIVCLLHL